MKKVKKLKLALIILIIVFLAMVSFVGLYVKNKNEMKNVVPEYLLGRDLEGYRRVELKVNDHTETIKYDADGKEIASTDTQTEAATTEERKINLDEILTKENFRKSKEIIEKRLSIMNVEDYIIRQNEEDGTIILELPENENTDRTVGQLYLQGKFEIVDKDTNEVLMTNADLKEVKGGYGTNSSGTTIVFLNLQFNKEGSEKFKNITNTYRETTKEVEATEQEEAKTETVTKEISIKIDDTALLSTHFDEEISNGLLQLSLGSSTSSSTSSDQIQDYLLEANSMEATLDPGKMPIVYEVEQNKFIFSNITLEEFKIVILAMSIVITIGIIYAIFKYKFIGLLASISLIGYIALYLIAIRYFNAQITIGACISILFSIVLSYAMLIQILKQKQVIEVIKQSTLKYIPILIIAIVFTFMNKAIGVTLFWGIVISILYNYIVTNLLIKDELQKEDK